MVKSQSKVIDGITFTVTQLPATRALKLFTKLVEVAGPALEALQKSPGSGLGDMEVAALGGALSAASSRLGEEGLMQIAAALFELATATWEGAQAPVMARFDVMFQGRLTTLFKAIGFALEVNYGDFLGALRNAAPGLSATMPASPSAGLTT
jgi:hypothetical protein